MRDSTRRAAEVVVGEELPELRLPITPTFVVATAVATRDFQAVHHDKDGALETGSQHIFLNILTTNGIVGRFVTDWAGPEAEIKKVAIRLGVPAYPGDDLVVTGMVVSNDGGVVEVEVVGRNSSGDHVSGAVTVALP